MYTYNIFYHFVECYENQSNCFEQLCINYTNERLQQHFVQKMLTIEEEWYSKDGLDVPKIPFFDNIDIIGLYKFIVEHFL